MGWGGAGGHRAGAELGTAYEDGFLGFLEYHTDFVGIRSHLGREVELTTGCTTAWVRTARMRRYQHGLGFFDFGPCGAELR